MKKIAVGLLVCWAAFLVSAAEGDWLTDFSKAQTKAKAEKKMVLADFNGSDWCPPCKALRKNVFSSPEFQKYAKDNLVLLDVDFPHQKKQSEEQKKANEALAQKYGIEGFPTVIVFSSDGKQLTKKVGYGGEDPKAFIADLQKLKTES